MATLNNYGRIMIALSVIYAGYFIFSIWTEHLGSDVFGKVSLTYVAIMALLGFVIAVRSDVSDNEKLKKDKYIN